MNHARLTRVAMLNHFWWPQTPVPHASPGFQLLGTQCSRFTSTLPCSGDAEPHSKLIICMPRLAPAPVSTPLTCYGEIHLHLTQGHKGHAGPRVDHAITSAPSLLPRDPEASRQPAFGSTIAKAPRAQSATRTRRDVNPPTQPAPHIPLPVLQQPTFDALSISASPWGGEPQAQHFWFPITASRRAPGLRPRVPGQQLCPCCSEDPGLFNIIPDPVSLLDLPKTRILLLQRPDLAIPPCIPSPAAQRFQKSKIWTRGRALQSNLRAGEGQIRQQRHGCARAFLICVEEFAAHKSHVHRDAR